MFGVYGKIMIVIKRNYILVSKALDNKKGKLLDQGNADQKTAIPEIELEKGKRTQKDNRKKRSRKMMMKRETICSNVSLHGWSSVFIPTISQNLFVFE